MKIDPRKAFDSIRWEFLFDALILFKFPPKFVYWLRTCITTTKFSVKVNGSLCGYFKGVKGLRQGDPLSPYLFVLALEVLSLIISHDTKTSNFKHHWLTKEMGIFTSDLILGLIFRPLATSLHDPLITQSGMGPHALVQSIIEHSS